jgi:uncharacterized membrane protein YbhN (UPF0104 family)
LIGDMTGLWSTITATIAVLGHAKIGFVAAAFAVDTLSLVLMAFRWRLLLNKLGSGGRLWETLLAYSAGVCVCNITPARAIGGDACRTALIRRPGGSPPVKAIAASVVIDRATDVPGFLMLGVIALPVLRPTSPTFVHWGMFALVVLAAALVARPLYRRVISRIGQRHQEIVGHELGAAVAAAVGCSLMIWLLDITRIMLVGRAFGVRFVPSQAAAVSLLRLGSGLVPVPAGIGVVDGALVAAFMWLGQPATTAAAMAVMERAIVYVWGTVLGAVALLLLGGSRALKVGQGGMTNAAGRAARTV